MAALDYDRIFLFTLSDLDGRASARDRRYGLLRESGEPKPLYHALARFLSICSPRLDPLPPLRLTGDLPDGLVSIHWQRADGRKVWMAWAAQAGTVTLPDVRDGEWHQPTKGGSRQIKTGGQGLDVAVDTTLQILVYG
jgi:beta-xylosidase